MLNSRPDHDYNLVLPDSFPEYIENIKSLIRYADKVIKNPIGQSRIKRLEEIANLKYELILNIKDIERYLESNNWRHVTELIKLRDHLDGRLYILDGRIFGKKD